jgi:thiamine transport system permease protein
MSPVPSPLRLPRWLRLGLIGVPALFLFVFYLWPVVTLLATVADGSTIVDTLGRPGVGRVVWFTLWQAVLSTIATLIVGVGPAFLVARFQFRGRGVVTSLVTVAFLMPTVVVGAGFSTLLPQSMRHTAAAVIVAHVFFNVAVVVRIVGTFWSQTPRDLASAARVLGASRWRAALEVTVPVLRPAMLSAAAITFLFTFTSFGVVQILGGPSNPTIEVEVWRRATQLGDVGGAAVLSLLQLLALALVIVISVRAQRRSRIDLELELDARQHPRGPRQRAAVAVATAATATAMLAPFVALAVSSIRPGGVWSLTAWTTLGDAPTRPGAGLNVQPLAAIAASCRAAALATVVAVTIGALATLGIARARTAGRLLDVGSMLPLGTSAVTIGFGMLITFDRAPVDWRGQPWLVPLGHALVAIPFVVRATLPVLASRPNTLIEAAATLGATPTRAWWEIDARLIRRPLIVGAGFAAAISFGEFGATTLLSRTGDETVPLAIGRLLSRAGDLPRAQAAVLALILAAITTLLLVAVDALGGDDARRA